MRTTVAASGFRPPDGAALIPVNPPLHQSRRVLDTFRSGGGDGKPVRLQADFLDVFAAEVLPVLDGTSP